MASLREKKPITWGGKGGGGCVFIIVAFYHFYTVSCFIHCFEELIDGGKGGRWTVWIVLLSLDREMLLPALNIALCVGPLDPECPPCPLSSVPSVCPPPLSSLCPQPCPPQLLLQLQEQSLEE